MSNLALKLEDHDCHAGPEDGCDHPSHDPSEQTSFICSGCDQCKGFDVYAFEDSGEIYCVDCAERLDRENEEAIEEMSRDYRKAVL